MGRQENSRRLRNYLTTQRKYEQPSFSSHSSFPHGPIRLSFSQPPPAPVKVLAHPSRTRRSHPPLSTLVLALLFLNVFSFLFHFFFCNPASDVRATLQPHGLFILIPASLSFPVSLPPPLFFCDSSFFQPPSFALFPLRSLLYPVPAVEFAFLN